MRIRAINIKNIIFTKTEYSKELYDSINRIGFSFPIHVKEDSNKYYCVDGHKRLSVLTDLLALGIKKSDMINVIITNNGDIRSNDCSRGRNTH